MRACTNVQRIHAVCRRLTTEAARRRSVIAEKNPNVNALVFTSELPAPSSEFGGDTSRPLFGWSIAIKDNICTNSMPTTCSSEFLKGSLCPSYRLCITKYGHVGFNSPYDATVVTLLRESGADIIGKTNCDEFGMGYIVLQGILLSGCVLISFLDH